MMTINLSNRLVQNSGRFAGVIQNNGLRFVTKANKWLAVVTLVTGIAVCFYLWHYPAHQLASSENNTAMKQDQQEPLLQQVTANHISLGPVRNIFEPIESSAAQSIIDPTTRFKITGIILDREPQAVLQDLDKGKSVFVGQGDRLAGFLIKHIQEGKVILSLEGREWELKP
jgi:type II secretory pathway component PulC